MDKIINVGIQVLPYGNEPYRYYFIDKAIEVIENSGLNYKVCPFETVIEGYYDEVMAVVKEVQETCYEAGAEMCVVNIRIHSAKDEDIYIEDKLKKFEL